MIKGKKILVTGGTGYIGSHTSVELIKAGFEIVIADNLSNSKIEVLKGIEEITGKNPDFYNVDFSDKIQVEDFFNKVKNIDAVIHFAAFKAVGESVENPLKYYRNNVGGMINLLDAMQENRIENLVFSSSCTVYGQPDILPVDESAPIKPALSPYGNTKQICEEIITDICKTSENLFAVCLRYFNPVGAHPSAKIGELPIGVPNNLVPFITQTAAGIHEKLMVFGNDYNTRDGSCVRDYINVVDLALAHVLAVKRLVEKNTKGSVEFFNLGTGTGVTVFEVIKAFEEATGVTLNYNISERRQGDVEAVFSDNTLAEKELNWKPTTNLNETMLSAWNWEKTLRKK
ncbi:MAG: UDP-glucose 4-epimerase GalE [Bacteroidales bacterium]|nr:UDP-glucose 4-epimerase GalE [Bacteroidales bacterium]